MKKNMIKIPCILVEELNLFLHRVHQFPSVGAAFQQLNNLTKNLSYGMEPPSTLADSKAEPYIHLIDVKTLIGSIARGELDSEKVLEALNSTGE